MIRRLFVTGLVVVALVPGGAVASVSGSPDLSVSLVGDSVTPGTDATLRVKLVNEGDIDDGSRRNPGLNEAVTTARGVSVSVDASGAPFAVETDTRSFGRLAMGAGRTVGFDLSVPADAEPGTYTIPVTVEYTYTDTIAEATGARQSQHVERTFEVTVEVRETPQFRVVDVGHDVRVGASGTVDLTVKNTGSATAHETALTVRSQSGALRFGSATSATRFVGRWAPGETRTLTYRVTAAPDAGRQAHAFTATASYEDDDGDPGESDPLQFTVRPRPEQRFAVTAVESDVAVGESGTVAVTLRNAGPTTVRDATVTLAATHADLRFGNATSATRFVGRWAPGERRTLIYRVAVADRAETRSYAVAATVAYSDADGDRRTARPGSLGVTPTPEQTFAYRNVSVRLSGSTARVTGRVVNTGDRPVEDARVTVESGATRLRVTDGTQPVGTLEPGESARFGLGVRVLANTHPGPRELGLAVRYGRGEGRTYTSDTTSVRVPIRTDRDDIVVTAVNATLGVDTTNAVRVRLRNVGDQRLTHVRARLAVRTPYESNSPTAYVASLDPNESAVVTFEVTTPEDDVPSTDAISLNVTARTPAEQRIRFGPYLVPVRTTTTGGTMQGLPTLGLGAVVVVALVAAGWWWLN